MKYLASVFLIVVAAVTACGTRAPETFVLHVWQTETDKGAIQSMKEPGGPIEEFEKGHPGVKVALESVAWSALAPKLTTALLSHSEPELTHIEPFMTGSLTARDLLMPIDDVVRDIERENADTIYDGVKNLQTINGHTYGIAYAVGITAFAYRKDVAARLKLSLPRSWSEYVTFVKSIHDSDPHLPVLLPGGDPFFVDQLFAELVVNVKEVVH